MLITKRILKPALNHLVRPAVKKYLTQERLCNYKGLLIKVSPGVFHPGLFFSTKVMLSFMNQLDLSGKSILETGSGSGLIAIVAAKQKARVTAIDINAKAVKNTAVNAKLNGVPIEAIQSDLFNNLPPRMYDVVLLNPPFLQEEAANTEEQAWYCGKNGEFFQRFFKGIKKFTSNTSDIYMVFSDEAPEKKILATAYEAGFTATMVYSKTNLWEMNCIWQFKLKP